MVLVLVDHHRLETNGDESCDQVAVLIIMHPRHFALTLEA